jgi:hypothetical protein
MTRRRKLAEAKPPQPQPPAGGPMTRRGKLAEAKPPPEDLLSAPPEDRLSALPDGVLGEIVSLLPTKDGARTPALASRWRHLWHSSPLNIDYCDLTGADNDDKNNRSRVAAEAISCILSVHQGPTRRLSVKRYRLNFSSSLQQDAWLDSPTLNGLQEIEFWFDFNSGYLPQSIYRFSATLRVATFGDCLIPDDAVHGLHFPNLKQLALERFTISEPSLHSLIAGCPELEGLLISGNDGFRRLRIDSLTLTSICVREVQLEELVVHNAPRLERLIRLAHFFGSLRVSVISAPKLHTLGFLSDNYCFEIMNTTLLFGSSAIQVFTHPRGLINNSWFQELSK